MVMIYSHDWGTTQNPANVGQSGGPALNNNCGQAAANGSAGCSLGVRAAYVLIRNLGGMQGLSVKAGRQYVIFGNHSLFGHFDWANTGFSHDGIMFQYATKAFESYLGWFVSAETDIPQGTPVGSGNANIAGCNQGTVRTACNAAQRAGG